jgi:rhomboid family GlyGly-CTERM serine protease
MGLDKVGRNRVKTSASGGWWLPVAIILLALILYIGGESTGSGFRFDRTAISAGEFWRLASGHFVHLGGPHLALNAAGLALVWFLVGQVFDGRQWLLVLGMSLLTMDLGLWFLNPGLDWYVGLSGLLHGFLAAGLVARLRRPDRETLILAALVLGKLVWEQLSGPMPGSENTAGGPVVVDAHLYGALGGVLAALVLQIRVRSAAAI